MIGLTDKEFVERLIEAGWTRAEAEAELERIKEEPEEDWEGQL